MAAQTDRERGTHLFSSIFGRRFSLGTGLTLGCLLLLASCATPTSNQPTIVETPGGQPAPIPTDEQANNPSVISSPGAGLHPATPPDARNSHLVRSHWSDLPGWSNDNLIPAWGAFKSSCLALVKKVRWAPVCRAANDVDPLDAQAIQHFFHANFVPYRVINPNGTRTGTITGYYEPVLEGSLYRHGPYQTPLYSRPRDVSHWRLTRPRAQLLASGVLKGHELVWVNDPVEAAFLQIQGSGVIQLDNGRLMRVGFAGTNEHAFRSFATWLIRRGEITYANATMRGIKDWARAHPQQVARMLNSNPRYVYFRALPINNESEQNGPIGALGVPLTPQRSIAIDPTRIPLGAPVFLSTTQPLSGAPLQKLMMAQDTGNAIKGSVRADFFWGRGDTAGLEAGRMKQRGSMWVLLPR